jgi:hypothetical protein
LWVVVAAVVAVPFQILTRIEAAAVVAAVAG